MTDKVATGRYTSASEVIREGLRALDRQDELFDEILRAKVQEALDDPRPSISLDEAFDCLNAMHEARIARGD